MLERTIAAVPRWCRLMSASRYPAYLQLMGSFANDSGHARAQTTCQPLERDPATGAATRTALLERLDAMGHLAPRAPLSFLVVKVAGTDGLSDSALRLIASRTGELIRATDVVGRLTGTSFGIALQSTG